MDDLIRRSDAENIFRNARKHLKPENYSGQEFFIRDNILLNAEQIVNSIPAVDAIEYELADDGTLEITVPNGTKVGRVLVSEAGTHLGGLYYPDAVDAVEVCRCKDCRYGTIDQYSAGEYVVVCDAPKKRPGTDVYALDWYCPMGQRREDGDA